MVVYTLLDNCIHSVHSNFNPTGVLGGVSRFTESEFRFGRLVDHGEAPKYDPTARNAM